MYSCMVESKIVDHAKSEVEMAKVYCMKTILIKWIKNHLFVTNKSFDYYTGIFLESESNCNCTTIK